MQHPVMDVPTAKGKMKMRMENQMVRKREREFQHDQMWNNAKKYYEHWQQTNTKLDSWTSPRYYQDNNKLMEDIKKKREKEEQLEKRREKLRRLYEEDRKTYDIELMIYKTKPKTPVGKVDSIPTEVLKEVNSEFKLREQDRKRHEAELQLYHQWRINNPIIRQYESKYQHKDSKLSWLDQQIEKRMQKEREEEEMKQLLKEKEEKFRKHEEEEQNFEKFVQERKQRLKECLELHMKELHEKEEAYKELKMEEIEENKHQLVLANLEEEYKKEEIRRATIECALYNVKQHKMKLKQKAHEIQESLANEVMLINRLKELELQEMLDSETKRMEVRESFDKYFAMTKEHQDLERRTEEHLKCLFDSEAKAVYEKQQEVWKMEETIRANLFKKVMDTLKSQIEEKVARNKERQKQIEKDKIEMMRKIQEYNQEVDKLAKEEEEKKHTAKEMIDDDVMLNTLTKKHQENIRLKEINEQLDRIKKEEERLQEEILKMQRK
ncbi:unnamed protein product [Acanthoscelides obtectus]|uniref:Trichoplein keratin filament-binding protein n=1 Tax=Acanthoscelides obtectus TaxID=200917 RepID=A0A9P0KLW1_ACAOB|nr:unnamed protein product [Acanthoscelides obtectus]CAK1665229.1 Trichoplein keratin filament-binding protein [Acanthoscelides obtectus]